MTQKSDNLQDIGQKMMSLWQDYLSQNTGVESLSAMNAMQADPASWAKMMTEFNKVMRNPFEQFMNQGQNKAHESNLEPAQTRTEASAAASDGRDVLLFQLVSRLADVERRLADLESKLSSKV